MALRMSGRGGELRNGYQVAARLGSWQMSESQVECNVVSVDEFWLEEGTLHLCLDVGSRVWVWRDIALADRNSRPMVIQLVGSPEVQ